ncbi:MAG: hypothetical protein COB03_13260, partial [Alteromonas sp.]
SAYIGGGMFCDNSSPTLTNCTFEDNTAAVAYGSGGGMACRGSSSAILTNCTFSNNTAGYGGGGFLCSGFSYPTLDNCTFTNNKADHGGGMTCSASSPTLDNCTFTGNTATATGNPARGGGGIYFAFISSPSPSLTDCILWDNQASNGPEILTNQATLTVAYSDVKVHLPP